MSEYQRLKAAAASTEADEKMKPPEAHFTLGWMSYDGLRVAEFNLHFTRKYRRKKW